MLSSGKLLFPMLAASLWGKVLLIFNKYLLYLFSWHCFLTLLAIRKPLLIQFEKFTIIDMSSQENVLLSLRVDEFKKSDWK